MRVSRARLHAHLLTHLVSVCPASDKKAAWVEQLVAVEEAG